MSEGALLPEPERKREFVRDMFDRIAPRYDLLNRLISLGLDQGWRRQALEAVSVGPGDRVVDLAAGTGDFAALARERGARATAVDLSAGMLRAARARGAASALVQADGCALPLRAGSATVITCGFALRNFSELAAILAECARVLGPGGRLVLLEIDQPRSALARFGAGVHLRRIVPRLGALLSDAEAYRYLPASLAYLPPPAELTRALRRSGFGAIVKHGHLFGAAQRVTAERSA